MTITPNAEATGAAKPAMSKGHLGALKPPRLPYHEAVEERFGIDRAGWKALVEAIYPNAETADASHFAARCAMPDVSIHATAKTAVVAFAVGWNSPYYPVEHP